MSVAVLIGVILAIIIAVLLVRFGLAALARTGFVDPLIHLAVWTVLGIVCIFLIALALNIPIPFFKW